MIYTKTFSPDFFDLKNFIVSQKEFSFTDSEDTRTVCHVCYNVNDPFISIMGASMVSILEIIVI